MFAVACKRLLISQQRHNCAVHWHNALCQRNSGQEFGRACHRLASLRRIARMVLVAAKEEDSDSRVFTRAKSNNSVDTGGFSYSIEAIELQSGIVATRVVWGEPLEGSSRSILAKVEGDGKEDGEKMRAAKQFLIETLSEWSYTIEGTVEVCPRRLRYIRRYPSQSIQEIGMKPSKSGLWFEWGMDVGSTVCQSCRAKVAPVERVYVWYARSGLIRQTLPLIITNNHLLIFRHIRTGGPSMPLLSAFSPMSNEAKCVSLPRTNQVFLSVTLPSVSR